MAIKNKIIRRGADGSRSDSTSVLNELCSLRIYLFVENPGARTFSLPSIHNCSHEKVLQNDSIRLILQFH